MHPTGGTAEASVYNAAKAALRSLGVNLAPRKISPGRPNRLIGCGISAGVKRRSISSQSLVSQPSCLAHWVKFSVSANGQNANRLSRKRFEGA